MILIVIVKMVRLMAVRLALECLAQAHLGLEVLVRTAIEQAVVLAVIMIVVHRIRIMGGRIGAWRSIR